MIPKRSIEFTSTRDRKLRIDFWQSLAQGVAPDGGLLVPTSFPKIPKELISDRKFWDKSSMSDISTLLHRLFIPTSEISDTSLKEMMKKAHNFDLPLETLGDKTYILRIDTGPTASFKDVAARSLASLLDAYCQKFNTVINIVVATSGDTGVAIADAFGGSKRISVTIIYPSGGVSEIQEKQMLQADKEYKNVQSLPVMGNFDICQDLAKLLQNARELRSGNSVAIKSYIAEISNKLGKKISVSEVEKIVTVVSGLHLSSANSINIWRLIPQMTQYFVAYAKLVRSKKIRIGEEIIFAVPSGNVGHLVAGLYARAVGLPVKKFIVGTNANNILANIIGSGTIKHRPFSKTSSPSMDILDPSNLERLLYFAASQTKNNATIDFAQMKLDIKRNLSGDSKISLDKYGVTSEMHKYLQKLIWAEDVETDDEIYAMMERVSRQNSLTLEPHGVTALVATIRARSKKVIGKDDTVVIMETAHPDKFPTALAEAGIKVDPSHKHPSLSHLAKVPLSKMSRREVMPVDLLKIARKIESISF